MVTRGHERPRPRVECDRSDGNPRMERFFLIRYGLMGQVGRFAADPDAEFERVRTVIVRSHRGTELGEVLVEAPEPSAADVPPTGNARVLRSAGPDDLEHARRAGRERDDRFATCLRVFQDGVWPIDLIDVEPLLDDRRTVLHYLGPHRLDVDGVLAAFRACDRPRRDAPAGRSRRPRRGTRTRPRDGRLRRARLRELRVGRRGLGSTRTHCSSCGIQKLLTSRR